MAGERSLPAIRRYIIDKLTLQKGGIKVIKTIHIVGASGSGTTTLGKALHDK